MADPSSSLSFTGETLRALKAEIGNESTLLGFIGTPWTLAAYAMEGKADKCVRTAAGAGAGAGALPACRGGGGGGTGLGVLTRAEGG